MAVELDTELGDAPLHMNTHTHNLLYSYIIYAGTRTYYITSNDKIFSKEIIKRECSGLWLLTAELQRRLDGDNEDWQKKCQTYLTAVGPRYKLGTSGQQRSIAATSKAL